MPWQNVFAAFFQAGNTVVIDSGGLRLYLGTPTAGNLMFSVVPYLTQTGTAKTDVFGNVLFPGLTIYSASGQGNQNTALNITPGRIAYESNPTGQQAGSWSIAGQIQFIQLGNYFGFEFIPGLLILLNTDPAAIGTLAPMGTMFLSDLNARPTWWSNSNAASAYWNLDRSLTDTTVMNVAGTNISPVNFTKQYAVDAGNGLVPGSIYVLKTYIQGVAALNTMVISVNLNGTYTGIIQIAGQFTSGVVSGQGFYGWIELEVMILSAVTARVRAKGMIESGSPQSYQTSASFCTLGSASLAFTGGTVGLAVNWVTSNAVQQLTCPGSSFTREC